MFLRHMGASWPTLIVGGNALSYAEDGPDAGGERRVRLLAGETRPVSGFLGIDPPPRAVGCRIERGSSLGLEDAVRDTGTYLRLSGFACPDRAAWSVAWPLPESLRDWREVKAVRLVYRVPTWCGRVQINAEAAWGENPEVRHLGLGAPPMFHAEPYPVEGWRTVEKSLPLDWGSRHDVRSLVLSAWGPSWKTDFEREDRSFSLEIGSLDLVRFRPGERERLDEAGREAEAWRQRTAESPIRKRLEAVPLPSGPRVNPRDVLARGMWAIPVHLADPFDPEALGVRDEWEFRERVLDDLKAHHLNAVQVEVPYLGADLECFVKLAHEKAFHLWGVDSYLAQIQLLDKRMAQPEIEAQWASAMARWEAMLTKWKDVPTWLGWAVGEEPYPGHLPYLLDARQRLARIGAQPQIMLHNNREVLLQDSRTPPPPGGNLMDCYIMLTLHVRKDKLIRDLEANLAGARQCGGVAWWTPQLIADEEVYGALTQPRMRYQIWTPLAYNVKGFFPWYYTKGKNRDFTDKPHFTYYGEEMARLEAVEKLLVAMERKDDLQLLLPVNEAVLSVSFEDRWDPAWRFALLANQDLDNPVDCALQPVEDGMRMMHVDTQGGHVRLAPVEAGSSLRLEAGDGTILFVGTVRQAADLRGRYWEQLGLPDAALRQKKTLPKRWSD